MIALTPLRNRLIDTLSDFWLFVILAATGLATGTLTGLTGASGMSVLISMLLLAGIPIREVIGLTFVITLVNSVIASGFYWRHGRVDVRSASFVALPAMASVLVGNMFSQTVKSNALTMVMAVSLFSVGIKFLLAPEEKTVSRSNGGSSPSKNAILLISLGLVTGILMGVMGGGGAMFIGIALIVLLKFETKIAVGTSILIIGLAAIPGVVLHWHGGTLQWTDAFVILSCSIPATVCGSWFANRISARDVKRLLGCYLVVIAPILLYRTFM